ncbi:MAG: SCO family protein [Chitinophagales bacterium]|nr:SCO family protein [Chitinophagales bacterium]MBP6154069.1 SCO family protein [Chitinophagales bacterium]
MKIKIYFPLIAVYFILVAFTLPDENKFLGKKMTDVLLTDSNGDSIRLFKLINGKPLIIIPIYTKCASICGVVNNGTKTAIRKLGTLGKEFNAISFSFDSTDIPFDLQSYQYRWGIDGVNWKAVSANPKNIKLLTQNIGFDYDVDTVMNQYNHPAYLVVLTPEGRISRFIYGVNPSKRDIELAVLAAKAEKTTPGLFTGIYLRCFGYDPVLKTYKVDWRFILSTSAGILIIMIMTTIFLKTFILPNPNYVHHE